MTYFSDKGPDASEEPKSKNVPAVLGLIFGIMSIFTFDRLAPQVLAVLLSLYGLKVAKTSKRKNGKPLGKVPARIGLILGIIYTIEWVAFLALGRL